MLNRKITYRWMSGTALVIFTVLLILIYLNSNSSSTPEIQTEIPIEGLVEIPNRLIAPEFSWLEEANNSGSLANYKGQVVYINFWALWCEPCVKELPFISDIKSNHQQKDLLNILLINFDQGEKEIENAKSFVSNISSQLQSVYGQSQVFLKHFPTEVLPMHIIIDKKGRLAAKFYGDILDKKEQVIQILNTLLEENN
jgi:thiol-disulfide isomerase/thioredoxin